MMKQLKICGEIVSEENKWIYEIFGIACTSPNDITVPLSDASNEDIEIIINSPGGEIFAATAIFEAIRSYSGHILIKIEWAASAASVIACAAESEIAPTGMMMIHNVRSTADGDYRYMSHESDVLLQASKAIATAYKYKTGKSIDELLSMMDVETWLTAEEAVEMGFADKISESRNSNEKRDVRRAALAAAYSGLLPEQTLKTMQKKRAKLNAELEILKLKGAIL